MAEEPTVFVVDDDEAVRDAISMFLEAVRLQVEGYPSAEAFLHAYHGDRAGCIILDVRMPGMSGLETQQALAVQRINLPVIFISGHGNIPTSVKALKSGALDFLEKPFSNEQLLGRIREALKLNAQWRKEQREKSDIRACLERLTPREVEVMELVVQGNSNKAIAAKLGLSYRTVEIHRARVMEKLRARSLADLIMKAIVSGYAEDLTVQGQP